MLLFRLNRIGFAIDVSVSSGQTSRFIFYKDSPPSEAGHPTLFTNNVVHNPFLKECSKHATESHADRQQTSKSGALGSAFL